MVQAINDFTSPVIRCGVLPEDRDAIRRIVESTGFFNPAEVGIAVELVDDWLTKRDASDYSFLVAEVGGHVVGYTCLSPIEGTQSSWDLHWIAVSPDQQGTGIGRRLIVASEDLAKSRGATRVYVDTSGRAQYEPTRKFYERCGYEVAATLPDFYAPGDAKVLYLKVL